MAIIANPQGTERLKEMGWQFADGFVEAYDHDRQLSGVIEVSTDKFYPTVPLNGWRARELAEEVFGRRSAGEMLIGRTFITLASVLQQLPGWDGKNQAIVDSYEGAVYVQVVMYDPGYGHHIRIIPAD